MRIVRRIEDELKLEVRNAIAKDPIITITGMQEVLEQQFGREYSFAYVSKLMDKVVGQARSEIDRAKINPRLVQLRETYRLASRPLIAILSWDKATAPEGSRAPLARDVIEASKNLVMLNIAVLTAEVANGMYKSVEEASANLRYPALPEASQEHIIAAFDKWGMLPKQKVHQMVEQQITTTHATRVITTSS